MKTFGADSNKFELLLKIGQQGTIEQLTTIGANRVGSCLTSKVGEPQLNNLSPFPAPPHPDYWVRLDLTLVNSASALVK